MPITIIKPETGKGKSYHESTVARFEKALKYRQDLFYGDRSWKRAIKLNAGMHWAQRDPDDEDITSENVRDRITVNITGAAVQDFLPFLVRQNPEFILTPTGPEEGPKAKLATAGINHFWQKGKMTRQYKMSVQDMLVIGHGILKTGYRFEVDMDQADDPTKHGELNFDTFIKVDHPFLKRVNPFKFVFDPTADDATLHTARWAAEILFKPLQDVVTNERYDPKVRKKIGNGTYTPETVDSFLTKHFDGTNALGDWSKMEPDELEAQQLVVLFEFWDKKFSKYMVFAGGVEEPLIEEDWKYDYLEEFPFVLSNFQPINDQPYGPGLPMLMEDQQHEKNRIRTAEFQHRRKFSKRKFVISQNAVSSGSELEKLLNDKDEYIVVQGVAQQSISELPAPSLPSDNYRVDQVIDEDIRQILGQDELATGKALPSRTTAREVDVRQGLIGLKAQERVERVDELAYDAAEQILAHLQANLEMPRMVSIIGPDGTTWAKLTKDEIQGKFGLDLQSSSKEEYDPATEKAQRLQIMQVLTQNAEFAAQQGVGVDIVGVTEWALESFDRPEIERFFYQMNPEPGPEQAEQEVSTELPPDDIQSASVNPASLNAGAMGGQSGGLGV
jgi:hypothetical protein